MKFYQERAETLGEFLTANVVHWKLIQFRLGWIQSYVHRYDWDGISRARPFLVFREWFLLCILYYVFKKKQQRNIPAPTEPYHQYEALSTYFKFQISHSCQPRLLLFSFFFCAEVLPSSTSLYALSLGRNISLSTGDIGTRASKNEGKDESTCLDETPLCTELVSSFLSAAAQFLTNSYILRLIREKMIVDILTGQA